MGTALVMAVLIGIPVGRHRRRKQYSQDRLCPERGLTIFLASVPVFVLGLVFVYLFAVNLRLVPTSMLHSPGRTDILDTIHHLLLPATVLAIVNAAPLARYTRASMLDVLSSEYVTTARSKGLVRAARDHAACLPQRAHPDHHDHRVARPEAIAGAVITEQIFAWNGMGQLAVKAAGARDPSLMMGIILITGVTVLIANIVADIGYAVADPRVRYDMAKG